MALAVWSLALEIPDRKWWATTLQLIGGALAVLGFSTAYVRAAYGLTFRAWIWQRILPVGRLIERLWIKLLCKSKDVTINVQPAVDTAAMGAPTVEVLPGPLNLDTTLLLEQQVVQIADYASNLQQEFLKLRGEIHRLDGRIDQTHVGISDVAEKTLGRLQDEIEALSKRLDWAQVLDLRWAILGLGITVIGIALGY